MLIEKWMQRTEGLDKTSERVDFKRSSSVTVAAEASSQLVNLVVGRHFFASVFLVGLIC